MLRECFPYFLEIEAQFLGFDYQLLQFLFEQMTALGCRRTQTFHHNRADAWADFQHALRHQMTDHFVRGVGIDFKSRA